MNKQSECVRICSSCGRREPIEEGKDVWPNNWACHECGATLPEHDGFVMLAPGLAGTMTGMNPENFDELESVEDTNFWFTARNMLLTGLVKKYFASADSFLEIGCGNGVVLESMRQSRQWRRLAGAELHISGLRNARKRLGMDVELVQMDAREIPAREVFALGGAFDVIEHIAEDEKVLQSIRAVLAPGGGLILSVPQHPWLWSEIDELAMHQRRYSRGELEDKLTRNGFAIVFSSSFTALLLPLMVASRLIRGKNGGRDATKTEMSPPRIVNAVLKGVLHAEAHLTLLGVRWPFGGSRVVVAIAQ